MSANRKKTLFIALGSLLASSTAVAVLTFHTDAGPDADAATSGSTPQTLPAQMAENVDVAGHTDQTLALLHPVSGESGRYSDAFTLPAEDNDAPAGGTDSTGDAPSETGSGPSAAVETTNSSAAPSSFNAGFGTAESILALNQRSFGGGGGGGGMPGPQSPFEPGASTPEDPLDVEPLLPPDSPSNRPDPSDVGTDPEDGGCDVFTGCGGLDNPPGTVPGGDSPNGEPPATPVPEPGSLGLLAFGVALGAFLGRRRRRAPI
ncbi:hypothetical protein GCM10011487_04310 [Steroidobacter agaridevorans]|uniref:Ice-binding protein C-terminal domain-containing protein n=1 Tax=Steroidobacter agaridevorans TaxID=2695856 RepID=A0A829Y601_9GAMM|nr:PEP-CTERM sorting domain-containing protein [Steroidobacter agaridevorans]GFE78431.1 hypothetical protein GCM10011487_04310 [Steroidobacter agaridevorans]GFE89637.1 hypothetical protein GCM10011488_45910 [Steroidobacter agaridevorans]